MGRPERVNDDFKQTKLRKPQLASLKAFIQSHANLEDDSLVKETKIYCNQKNIKYLNLKAEKVMGNRVITLQLQTLAYSFKVTPFVKVEEETSEV